MEVRKEPAYREAMERILSRFDQGGYGVIITDDEFDSYMAISIPKKEMSYSDFKKIEMERLQRYRAIEELLSEHNVCLVRSKAVSGFELLPPKDQITIAFDRRMAKVRRELNRAHQSITNVNHELLSAEEEADRQKKMVRSAFIRCAINKRKIVLPEAKEPKKLNE